MRASSRGWSVIGLCVWLAGLLAAPAVQAWSHYGHRLVAEIAEAELQPAARAELDRLLALEQIDSLAALANWADELRDQAEHRHTLHYHFVNFPRGQCALDSGSSCAEGDCIISALQRYQARLGDHRLAAEQRLEALKFVVHLVGDIHQPLHAGWFDDRGGNGFQVNLDGEGSNLHKVWDIALLESAGEAAAVQLRRLQALDMAVPAGGIADWAMESCRLIGSQAIYPDDRRIGAAYLARHRPLAEHRVVLAGRRLGLLLNHLLQAPPADERSR